MENETPVQNSSANFIIAALSVVIVGLLGFMGYTYQTKQIVPKDKTVKFEELPAHIQDQYVLFNDALQKEKSLERTITKLNQKIQQLEKSSSSSSTVIIEKPTEKVIEKVVEVEKPVEVQKIVEVEKVITVKEQIDKSNYNTYTCKSFEAGGIVIPKKCEKELLNFLTKHNDAKQFELIGLVDDKEFRLIKSLEDVYGVEKIKDIKKYVQRGLSRQRVIELTWFIKESSDKKLNLNAVNYSLYSKDKRGFVVKAYY
jgi:hypothetical protein